MIESRLDADRRAQLATLPELLGHIVGFPQAWPTSLIEMCRDILGRHAALERRMDDSPLRRIAFRQHPDRPAVPHAASLTLPAALLPPWTPSDRLLARRIARLYGFELVAVNEEGREYEATTGGSDEVVTAHAL